MNNDAMKKVDKVSFWYGGVFFENMPKSVIAGY